jgi:hypothetical protein
MDEWNLIITQLWMKPIRIKEMGVTTGPIVRVCVCVCVCVCVFLGYYKFFNRLIFIFLCIYIVYVCVCVFLYDIIIF